MSTKSLGVVLVVLGLVLAAISLLADVLGLGADPGIIGWKQLLGAGVGVLIMIGGAVLFVRGRGGRAAQ
jgi:hypothetical protein